ncbi:HAD family hydrolase [Streptococcus agalactiae LMG 14747]|uniref:HAD family hydrolase n=1 Tax=Streptococcus agalactiae LMG 14747 TaxID=1154860 RepID=V6Z7P6_STRAG|nr:HAD family hydrolase [Streptococcus hyovaginalis]ESV55649.1 HAD family hydrolase [Streptococcus agalactiae LMG 14747]
MIKAIFFDLDDTLYDQLEPFELAFRQTFENINVPISEIYTLSRQYSDRVFEKSESGEMTIQDMHMYRIKAALEDFSIIITDEAAILFQKKYALNQGNIELDSRLAMLFEFLKKNRTKIGIITNGPKEHQYHKIKQLGLYQWFDRENILISSEIGIAKPNKKIFDLAKDENDSETYLYVGDSFENDVVGAKSAGWQTVWFNRRGNIKSNIEYQADYQVNDLDDLYSLITAIIR